MTRNYELVYCVAQNVGIIGILAYPKRLEKIGNTGNYGQDRYLFVNVNNEEVD